MTGSTLYRYLEGKLEKYRVVWSKVVLSTLFNSDQSKYFLLKHAIIKLLRKMINLASNSPSPTKHRKRYKRACHTYFHEKAFHKQHLLKQLNDIYGYLSLLKNERNSTNWRKRNSSQTFNSTEFIEFRWVLQSFVILLGKKSGNTIMRQDCKNLLPQFGCFISCYGVK